MEKIVKAGFRDCTVNLNGTECAVKFDSCFRAFAVRNDSTGDVYISKVAGIVPNADGVMSVKAGASTVFAHMDIYADTVYLLGNGKVQLHAQNDTANPFEVAPEIGGGKEVSGESAYTIENAVDYPVMGLNLYGKSTQDGTPTPENPVDIVSVGDSGSVAVTANNGNDVSVTANITSALPLCGIPVESGGNYTDKNGQQWVCDEVVYNADGSGKVVKRTAKIVFNNNYAVNYAYDVSKAIIYNVDTNRINGKVLCNVADYAIAKWDADVTGNCFWGGGNLRDIFVRVPVGLTNEEINNMGIKVIYQLAEPQGIPLTAAEMSALRELQTFDGITNIFNDGGADMSVNYCSNKTLSEYVVPITTSLQAQIDELKSAVLSLGGNI